MNCRMPVRQFIEAVRHRRVTIEGNRLAGAAHDKRIEEYVSMHWMYGIETDPQKHDPLPGRWPRGARDFNDPVNRRER